MARTQAQEQAQTIGRGVRVAIEGDEVVVRFNATGDFGLSASGKTRIVASTQGNVALPNGVTLGLNAYRKP